MSLQNSVLIFVLCFCTWAGIAQQIAKPAKVRFAEFEFDFEGVQFKRDISLSKNNGYSKDTTITADVYLDGKFWKRIKLSTKDRGQTYSLKWSNHERAQTRHWVKIKTKCPINHFKLVAGPLIVFLEPEVMPDSVE